MSTQCTQLMHRSKDVEKRFPAKSRSIIPVGKIKSQEVEGPIGRCWPTPTSGESKPEDQLSHVTEDMKASMNCFLNTNYDCVLISYDDEKVLKSCKKRLCLRCCYFGGMELGS